LREIESIERTKSVEKIKPTVIILTCRKAALSVSNVHRNIRKVIKKQLSVAR